jgi:hypothetical protein
MTPRVAKAPAASGSGSSFYDKGRVDSLSLNVLQSDNPMIPTDRD